MTRQSKSTMRTPPASGGSAAPNISHYPILDDKQIGHIRHIHNLAAQLDNDWDGMGTKRYGQEWTDSYRYQFTQMSYALGFAHFHHLPAAPGAFRPTFEEILRKMQLPEVWDYWYETSKGGKLLDPDIEVQREGWRDPIVKENIMYSGRFFAMIGIHSMLFNSDQYDQPGAISLRWEPAFHGLAPEVYEYTHSSISENLYWQMVATGWYGIVCEPNCLFMVCNQFAILGFRLLDLRKGTALAEEVTRAYTDAWEKRGMVDENGDFWRFWLIKQDLPVQLLGGAGSQWTALNMNAWNRELVHERYPEQILDVIQRTSDGLVTLTAPTAMVEIRRARKEGREPEFTSDPTYQWDQSEFGYTAACMAEVGDTENLSRMLAYADKYLNPTWKDGGLYYPRNDTSYDAAGNMVYMDRLTGNAMLAYARLNVPDGLWKMYNEPWGAEHFEQPNVTRVDGRVDFARAWYDSDNSILALTLRPVEQDTVKVELAIANVTAQERWTLFFDGKLAAIHAGSAQPSVHDKTHVDARYLGDTLVISGTIHSTSDVVLRLDRP